MIWKGKKKLEIINRSNNKKLISSLCSINHKNIYYKSIKDLKDYQVKLQIESIHKIHPVYGHKRLAIALNYSKNKILRIMHKYNIKPPRRRIKRYYTTRSINNTKYTNLIKNIIPIKPFQIYCSDITYIKYQNKFIYLATIQDIYTREIIAANISNKHDSVLTLKTIQEALIKYPIPQIFHSDQGTEYMANEVTKYIEKNNIQLSVSDKASPWQNGFKESFYSRFKDENGDLNRYEDLGELIEEIYSYINYYNTLRIHTKLKMSPIQFKQKVVESVLEKSGT